MPRLARNPAPPRRGAALIIAIAVLAALLFLALPFLFSQSASVAGARAGGWDGTARRAQGTAEGIAAAAAIYATGISRSPSLQVGTAVQNYTALPGQIANVLGIYAVADTAFRTIIETDKAWTDPSNPATVLREALDDPARVLHGALIEDESRRIDPNGLGERAWAVILRRAGVQDPCTIQWTWAARNPTGPANDPFTHGDWKMAQYGRLARALARWRPSKSGSRFAGLADLLGADPTSDYGKIPFGPQGRNPANGAEMWPLLVDRLAIEATRDASESDTIYVKPAPDDVQKGFRTARLTQVEIERLRPYLTFLALGQGRGGLIDLGSIIGIHTRQNSWDARDVLTDLPTPLIPTGSNATDIRPMWRNGAWIRDAEGHADFGGFWQAAPPDNTIAQLGEGLALDAAPVLSINSVPASSSLTLLYSPPDTTVGPNFGGPTAGIVFGPVPPSRPAWPFYPDQTPLTALDQMPLLRWLDPRAGDGTTVYERPALGTGGWGVVTVEGSATAIDPSGRAQAQRRRRIVMQTVPQERPVEAAWSTQAEMEALIRQRQGSWVMAGPQPTNRIAAWGSEAGDMAKLANAGWIEPSPVCSFGDNPAVAFDWLVRFGLTVPRAWGAILQEETGNVSPAPAPDPRVALTAQGLLINASTLAWDLGATSGPLRFAGNNNAVTGNWQEMDARHVSMRFALPSTAAAADMVLLEARAQDAIADNQTAWRVEYRHATTELVLVIANAARSWSATERSQLAATLGIPFDTWKTSTDVPDAVQDDRCNPGAYDFAAADPATQVEFHYIVKNGLQPGRWYHLQVLCAGDQPGMHGLILDGVVGRDAISVGVASETGDHYTFPSLRLATAAINATVPAAAGASALAVADISVAMPSSTLPLNKILPTRGLVRIDDEYFSYTGLDTLANKLTGAQRARRTNTDQTAKASEDLNGNTVLDPGEDTNGNTVIDMVPTLQCWPVTQPHAIGALVTPGWSQSWISNGKWLRGQVALKHAMSRKPAQATVTVVAGWDADGAPALNVAASASPWPATGFVRFWSGAIVVGYAAYSGGSSMTFDWTANAICHRPGVFGSITCELISIQVVGGIADTDVTGDGVADPLFAASGALQLLDPGTGRCEWISYTDKIAVPAGSAAGSYFINTNDPGWNMPDPLMAQLPLSQGRGAMRTPWRSVVDGPWPVDTVVLPVQTGLKQTDRFEDGDVATVVPRAVGSSTAIPRLNRPTQIVIRHAARDGYPTAPSQAGPAWDTSNEFFALAHRVPDTMADPVPAAPPAAAVPLQALIGRGWSGDDLSLIGNNIPRRGALPRLNLLQTAAGGAARLFVGCPDPLTGTAGRVLIDDLCAGTLLGVSDPNQATAPAQARLIAIEGSATGVIPSDPGKLPITVTASSAVFAARDILRYGLVWLDGEVFAFRRGATSNEGVLIARALLGSTRREHRLTDGPMVAQEDGPNLRQVNVTLPILSLPMGPVAELCSTLPAALGVGGADVIESDAGYYYLDPEALQYRGQDLKAKDNRQIMESPVQMIADPDGPLEPELLKLYVRPASNQRISAPWLRGLYGTTSVAWTGTAPQANPVRPLVWQQPPAPPAVEPPAIITWPVSGSNIVNPVVIGWWPRFAPGLPGGGGLSADERSAQLRSRVFAWAGFPLRLHGARFDPSIPVLTSAKGGITDVLVANDGGCSLYVRALATGTPPVPQTVPFTDVVFDWWKSDAKATPLSAGANDGLVTPFDWSRFIGREVDGAELRIHWYAPAGSTTFDSIAAAQGCTPRLGADDTAAAAAPAGTAAVRLRCVAPTRILAIEEVR